MRNVFYLVWGLLLFVSVNAFAENSNQINTDAIKASENFLLLLDLEDYDSAWEQSSRVLKIMKSKEEWGRELKMLHDLFGDQINRSPRQTRPFNKMLGLPDGDYYLVVLNSSFENKKEGFQSIYTRLDEDEKWRVVNYFVR